MTRRKAHLPLKNIFLDKDQGMVSNVPPPPRPPLTMAPTSSKPWMVNVAIDDPDLAQKLKELSAAYGKKPGPYLAQVISDWLGSIDIREIQQEALPIDKAS